VARVPEEVDGAVPGEVLADGTERRVTKHVPLNLVETRTFGSRVIYERYGRARDESD
jgi:hypothetical protein